MKNLSRRSLLSGATAALLGATLSGCVTTKHGTTTTFVVSVARINAYIDAGINASNLVLGVLANVPTMVAYVEPTKAALKMLNVAADAFHETAGDELIVEYNKATVKTRVDSILAAIEKLVDIIGKIVGALARVGISFSSDIFTKIQTTYDALATVVSIFVAILANNTTASLYKPTSGALAMTERNALKTLGV